VLGLIHLKFGLDSGKRNKMTNKMKQWLKQMFCRHYWIWSGDAFSNHMICRRCEKRRIPVWNKRKRVWLWRITLREEIWR
jgi:hypothetical protein